MKRLFLPALFSYNIIYGLICSLLLASFLFINYKKGVTAYPINQFGMYHGKFELNKPHKVYFIANRNGELLPAKLSIPQYERINFEAVILENHHEVNATTKETFDKLPFVIFGNTANRFNKIADSVAYSKLIQRAALYTGHRADDISIVCCTLLWNNDTQQVDMLDKKPLFYAK